MSLAPAPQPPKQYPVGIVASKSLDDPAFIGDLIGGNVAAISHLYSNGANPLVATFAADHGIPHTIFPLTGGRSFPWALSQILDHVQFVYIIGDERSHGSEQAAAACLKRDIKHKEATYEAVDNWRGKVGKVAEILEVIPKEDVAANEWAKAIAKVVR